MSASEKGEANTVINMKPLLENKAKRNAAASIAKLAKLRARLPVIHETENNIRINANTSSPKATTSRKSRKSKSRKSRKSRKSGKSRK
jgi:uncharacterized membrane protein